MRHTTPSFECTVNDGITTRCKRLREHSTEHSNQALILFCRGPVGKDLGSGLLGFEVRFNLQGISDATLIDLGDLFFLHVGAHPDDGVGEGPIGKGRQKGRVESSHRIASAVRLRPAVNVGGVQQLPGGTL